MGRKRRRGFFGKEFLEVEVFKGKGSRKVADKMALELELKGFEIDIEDTYVGGRDPIRQLTVYARKKKLGGLW